MHNLVENNVILEPLRIDRFPYKSKSIITIGIRPINFTGNLKIQGSLYLDNPKWFDLLDIDFVSEKSYKIYNIVSCPILIKAQYDTQQGHVDCITVI